MSNAGLINGDDSSMVIDALTAPVLTKAFIAVSNPQRLRRANLKEADVEQAMGL